MKAYCLVVALFVLWSPTRLFASNADGSVVNSREYQFPSYEEAKKSTDITKYADKAAYDSAVADESYEFQKLTYFSDRLQVVAYLYHPRQIASQLPVIVFNRGSYVRDDVAPELIVTFRELAASGFVIIAPMYRQSDGGEGRDEMGGADVNDVMNILPVIDSLEFADADNICMYGESRGGMMTFQAMKMGFPLKAAAVYGAFGDLEALMESNPRMYTRKLLESIWPEFASTRADIIEKRSAARWVEKLNSPLLIMHGGNDQSVSPTQALELAMDLQELRRQYELHIYAGDNHVLSENRLDRNQRAIAWFKKHLDTN